MTETESAHGTDGLRLARDSHAAAVDRIEQVVRDERIDCDFARLDAYLMPTPERGHDYLQRELDACHRIGWTDVQWVDRAPLPSFDSGRCLRIPRQGQFHPLKYLRAVANAITARGGMIFHNTHATEIKGGENARVATSTGAAVTCRAIVVATNSPVNDRFTFHTKQSPWRTYVIGMRVPAGAVPQALYWDTLDPYHYVRLQAIDGDPSHELLISGGEDHMTGHPTTPTGAGSASRTGRASGSRSSATRSSSGPGRCTSRSTTSPTPAATPPTPTTSSSTPATAAWA